MPDELSPAARSRRDLLASWGALAGGVALLNGAVAAQDNPAAQVADRASTIKITALRARQVGPVVYVKIETNHGISGWGDLKGVDPRVSKPLVESLYELIDGENP